MDYEKEFNSTQQGPILPATPAPRERIARAGLWCAAIGILAAVAAANPSVVGGAWHKIQNIVAPGSVPPSNSSAPVDNSDRWIERLANMPPQGQAELLAEQATRNRPQAADILSQRASQWDGKIELSPRLSGLLQTAVISNDASVRAAALDTYLAAYNIPKNAAGAAGIEKRIAAEPAARPWALWALGALGNRGVEPLDAAITLSVYAHDRDEQIRVWAMEGLGNLGTDATVGLLLDSLKNDPSPKVKERAAANLAQSGMLSHEQRMKATPALVTLAADPSFDVPTHLWIFQALMDITGEHYGNNVEAWQKWQARQFTVTFGPVSK
jgi:HEAT repeats